MKKTTYLTAIAACTALTACDDFLDKLPDNRAEIDSEDKIALLLVSAYPENDYLLLNEYMSDNVDDYGSSNPYTDRFLDQVFTWSEITESNNEDPKELWGSCYAAIAAANQAIESINELGGAETTSLRESLGEALACRAYAYFILVNEFCKHYNPATANTDLGVPYITKPEVELHPSYERGTVAEVYDNIEKDILAAIQLIDKGTSNVPKYHFSKKSISALAARFYLFKGQWAEAEYYSTLTLGDNVNNQLRDWTNIASLAQEYDAIAYHYVDTDVNSNLLLITSYSCMGLCFGPYRYFSRYSHGDYLAYYETVFAENIWNYYAPGIEKTLDPYEYYYHAPKEYSATNLNKVIWWKSLYVFEELDATNHIGMYRTVYPAFTADEILLSRAEARILQGKYDEAAADLDLWMQNIINFDETIPFTLTPELIQEFYNSVEYSTALRSTIKKHLNPPFEIDEEGSLQESMLQCVLGFRRIETIQMGLRWWDIRRYGIEVYRREMDPAGMPTKELDLLTKDDLRRTIQLPSDVIAVGLEANPR